MYLAFYIENSTLSNYEDDNNLFIPGEDKGVTKSLLSSDFTIAENWFFVNYDYILNPLKCHFMCSGKNVSDAELPNLNDLNLGSFKEVEISGVTS